MLRLFRPQHHRPWMAHVHGHFLPFDLESDRWEMVRDPRLADVIPIMWHAPIDELLSTLRGVWLGQTLLHIGGLFHMQDGQDTPGQTEATRRLMAEFADHTVVVHTNRRNTDPRDIHHDMMWNRQKAYFTDYDQDLLSDRAWVTPADPRMFELGPLVAKSQPTRRFLSPTRVHWDHPEDARVIARRALLDALPADDSLVSRPEAGIVLPPQLEDPDAMNYLGLGLGGRWYPVANHCYESTYISAYVETITNSTDVGLITEKTYDPLIKGHYILPFGYAGLIADIRGMGFWLPEWMDYSYDAIGQFQPRLEAYLASLAKLAATDMDVLHGRWHSERLQLAENRLLFWKRPYDSLYDRVSALRGV